MWTERYIGCGVRRKRQGRKGQDIKDIKDVKVINIPCPV